MARALAVFRDNLVARQASETALHRANAVFGTALHGMMQGMIVWGADHQVQFVNRRYFAVHDLPHGCVEPGMDLCEVVKIHCAHGIHPGETEAKAYRKLYGLITSRTPLQQELEVRSGIICQISLQPTPGGGCVVTFEDVTEKRLNERRIAHLARHDTLTGLANGGSFNQAIAAVVSPATPARRLPSCASTSTASRR